MSAAVKLDFNTDFTQFLMMQDYNDPVYVVTESETIKCNAVLLAQHSSVLRKYFKDDKELFLTDNKHVRECLSILYGGSVELSEENFQDILKFMVAFDIPSVLDQVLEWMSQNRWNLDNARLLIKSSMTAIKGCFGVADLHSLREKVYQPCRLFLGKRLTDMINPNSTDARYKNIVRARRSCSLGRVTDRKEQLAMLLHEDLIPEYIDWITCVMDQSVYYEFLSTLDRPEVLNKMSLCTREQFEGLFDKIENFQNITLKEFKNLNKYKLKIHEKMATCQSLRLMKENGNLYSCWKVMDFDGLSIVPLVCTDTPDQFCIVENLLSWLSSKKCSACDKDRALKLLLKTFEKISISLTNNSFQQYAKIVRELIGNLNIDMKFIPQNSSFRYHVSNIEIDEWFVKAKDSNSFYQHHGDNSSEKIKLCLNVNVKDWIGTGRKSRDYQLRVTVKLSPDTVPDVRSAIESCGFDQTDLRFKVFVYAWKLPWSGGRHGDNRKTNALDKCSGRKTFPIYIPLYTDPAEAFNLLKQYEELNCHPSNLDTLVSSSRQSQSSCVKFHILCV